MVNQFKAQKRHLPSPIETTLEKRVKFRRYAEFPTTLDRTSPKINTFKSKCDWLFE